MQTSAAWPSASEAASTTRACGLTEQLTIIATTDVLVSSAGGATGQTLGTVKYQVSRVTLSDIAAGKF